MNDICFNSPSSLSESKVGNLSNLAQPFGNYIYIAHHDGGLTVWDLNMRKCVKSFQQHATDNRSVSLNFDGNFLASGGFDS